MRIEEQAHKVLEQVTARLRALPLPAAQALPAKLDRPAPALLTLVQQALVVGYQGQITVPVVWRQILAVSPTQITPQPLDRQVDRVVLAQACRTLFGGLGLSSLRFRKYRSTHHMMVEVEAPDAHVPGPLSRWDFDHDEQGALGPMRKVRSAVTAHLEKLLDHAFPHLTDRSDSGTDYFDAVFSIQVREVPTAWDPLGMPSLPPSPPPPVEHVAKTDDDETDTIVEIGQLGGDDDDDVDEADVVPPPQGPADPAAYLEWLGIRVEATTTHPSRPGKAPRPVWNLKGNTAPYEPILLALGGKRWNSAWSFWEDPVAALADRIRTEGAFTFAAQQERQRQRAADRAERLTARAHKHATEGRRRIEAAHRIAGMIPFGQPVLVDHYSSKRHLGDLKRIDNHERKGWGALKYAEELEGRAEHNETIASGDRGLPYLSDRLGEAEAELRRIGRSLEGRLVYTDGKPRLQPPQGEDKTALQREQNEVQQKIDYWKAEITKAGGIPYGRHNVAVGDLVEHRGQWFPVVKVNDKTVRVSHWLNIAGVKSNVEWATITGVRRAEGLSLREGAQEEEDLPAPAASAAPAEPAEQAMADQDGQDLPAAPAETLAEDADTEYADAEEGEETAPTEPPDTEGDPDQHVELTVNGREIPCASVTVAMLRGGQDSYEVRVNGEMVLSSIRDSKNDRWITEVYAPLPFTSKVAVGPEELPSGAGVHLDSWNWATPIRPTQWMELPFGVGVRLDAKFATGSFDDLPAYLAACRGNTKRWTSSLCQVEKVVVLSPSAYDQYTAVGGDLKRQCPYLGAGGTRSDFSEAPFDPSGPPEHRFPWLAKSYRMVTVLGAPGREPFVVDPEGGNVAVAVGVQPEYSDSRAPVVVGPPLRVGSLPTTPIAGVGVPLCWRKIAEVQLVPVIEFDQGGSRTHLAAEARKLFKELGIPDVRVRVKGTVDVCIPRVRFLTKEAEERWDANRDHQNLGREVERRLSRIIHLAFPGHGNVRHTDPNADYPYLILIWMVDLHDEPTAKLDTGLISPAALEAPLYPADKRPAGPEPAPPPKPAPPAAHIPQITISGATFTLTRGKDPDKRGNPTYFLNGSRGAKYMAAAVGPITKRDNTIDERKHQFYLHNVGKGWHLPKHLERVWLTDEGGKLREWAGRRTPPEGVPIESIPIDGEPPPAAPAVPAAITPVSDGDSEDLQAQAHRERTYTEHELLMAIMAGRDRETGKSIDWAKRLRACTSDQQILATLTERCLAGAGEDSRQIGFYHNGYGIRLRVGPKPAQNPTLLLNPDRPQARRELRGAELAAFVRSELALPPPGPVIEVEDRSAAGDLALDAAAAAHGIPRAELSSLIEQKLEGRQIGWAGVPQVAGEAPPAPAPATAVVLQALAPLVHPGRVLTFDGTEYRVHAQGAPGKVLFSSPDAARVVQMSYIKDVRGGSIPKPVALALKSWQTRLATATTATAAPALSAAPAERPQAEAKRPSTPVQHAETPAQAEQTFEEFRDADKGYQDWHKRSLAAMDRVAAHEGPGPRRQSLDAAWGNAANLRDQYVETLRKDWAALQKARPAPAAPAAPAAPPAPSCPRPVLSDKGRQDRIDRLRSLSGALESQANALHQGIMSAYDSSSRRVTARRAEQLAGADDSATQKTEVQQALSALAEALDANCDGQTEVELDQVVRRCLPQSLLGVVAMPAGQIRPLVEDLLYKQGWPVPGLHRAHLTELLEASAGRTDLSHLRGVVESVLATGCTRSDGDVCPVSDPMMIEQLMELTRAVEKIVKDGALPEGVSRMGNTIKSMHHRADPYRRGLAAGLHSVDLWTAARDDLYALLQGKKPDARARRLREALGELAARSGSIPSYFPTPYDLADRMVSEANIRTGQRVLEPEAGAGHIADLIRQRGVLPDVVERDPLLGEILTLKGYPLRATDFLTYQEHGYDRAVMNPPFEGGADIQHVQHAYDLLGPGGRLVAIMSESAFIQNSSLAVAFRAWLKAHAGTSEELAPGSFRTSHVSTGVNVRLVVIDKED